MFHEQGSKKSGIFVTGLRANLEFRNQFVVRPEFEQKFRSEEPICGWAKGSTTFITKVSSQFTT